MLMLRTTLFNIFFYSWTLISGILHFPLMFLPYPFIRAGAVSWAHGSLFLAKYILGLTYEIKGIENIPEGGAIIASKHQSAFETVVMNVIFKPALFILKRELVFIPFVGWSMWRMGAIPINRSKGTQALRLLQKHCANRLAKQRRVIIFPEGTRTAPRVKKKYQPGIAMIYKNNPDYPVIPVALNSGHFWGRNAVMKYPGKITVEILPAMPKGLAKKEFLTELENRIEGCYEKLADDADAQLKDFQRD